MAEVLRPIKDESFSVAHEAILLGGGAPIRICYEECGIAWSHDGSTAYFGFSSMDSASGWKTFVFPLKKGVSLPHLPAAGARTPADLPDDNHLKVIDEAVYDGMSPSLYAFSKRAMQRNLYRVPVAR